MQAWMRALVWGAAVGALMAREQTDRDDEDSEQDPKNRKNRDDEPDRGQGRKPSKPGRARVRCYLCGGSGRLELVEQGDPLSRPGRLVRCIACRGTGRITVE